MATEMYAMTPIIAMTSMMKPYFMTSNTFLEREWRALSRICRMTERMRFAVFIGEKLTLLKPESDITQPQLNYESGITDSLVDEAESWVLGILDMIYD